MMAAVLAHTICSGGKKRTILSVPRLREISKKTTTGTERAVGWFSKRTDDRTDDRTIGRLRRRRKRPRHRRHESPTNRQKKKPQKVASFKTLTNDRERSGWWWVAIPSLLVTNDPRSLSLAPRARTMFSVEPMDQSARTTTLRFACVVVKEEKHRQSLHSSLIQPRGLWWWCGRRRISRVSTDREILPLTYRTNATRLVETGNGGVGRLGGNLLSDHRREFERVCVVAVVRRASRRVVSDARFKHGFLNAPQKWGVIDEL